MSSLEIPAGEELAELRAQIAALGPAFAELLANALNDGEFSPIVDQLCKQFGVTREQLEEVLDA